MNFHIDMLLYNELYGFVKKNVYNETDVSDILHDALTKAVEKVSLLKDSEKYKAWLYQIVRNTITDYHRKKRYMVDYDEIPPEDDFQAKTTTSEPIMPKILDEIPQEYREIYELAEEGFTHKEMAEILGISVELSKKRLSRAYHKIEDILKKEPMIHIMINSKDMSVKIREEILTVEIAKLLDQMYYNQPENERNDES